MYHLKMCCMSLKLQIINNNEKNKYSYIKPFEKVVATSASLKHKLT